MNKKVIGLGVVLGVGVVGGLFFLLSGNRSSSQTPESISTQENGSNLDSTQNSKKSDAISSKIDPSSSSQLGAPSDPGSRQISTDEIRAIGSLAKKQVIVPPMTNEEYFEKYLRDPERARDEKEFSQLQGRYRTLPGVLAYKTNELPPDLSSSVLKEFLSFSLVKGQLDERTPDKTFPVIFDLKQGTLAIVTGSIKVYFEDDLQSSAFERQFNLTLVQEFPDIKVASFRSSAPSVNELILTVQAIQKQAGVKNAALVLIDSVRKAH
jgi:hypothetical protein